MKGRPFPVTHEYRFTYELSRHADGAETTSSKTALMASALFHMFLLGMQTACFTRLQTQRPVVG